MQITIYTDGACSPNPGFGGWAAILISGKYYKEISGHQPESTNNRMELTAVLKGMQQVKKPNDLIIITDSAYIRNGMGSWDKQKPIEAPWIIKWERLGWNTTKGPLLNKDLWQEIWAQIHRHNKIQLKWIKGHNGDKYNETCDALAVSARVKGFNDERASRS